MPVDSELAVIGTLSSDAVVVDAVVTWFIASMTQPTCPSTGGFSLYRVFRLHGVCGHRTTKNDDNTLSLLLPFWQASLGVHSAKCRHQSPEWTILSHVNCFIQGEVIKFQVLLDSLHPRHTRASWWSSPVFQRESCVIIINGDGGCRWWQPTGGLTAQVSWLGLRVGSHLTISLHSSNEPS